MRKIYFYPKNCREKLIRDNPVVPIPVDMNIKRYKTRESDCFASFRFQVGDISSQNNFCGVKILQQKFVMSHSKFEQICYDLYKKDLVSDETVYPGI